MPHFKLSLAPGADARTRARISRSFFRDSFGAALIYAVTFVGRAFFGVIR
jgi:hypothetical protein